MNTVAKYASQFESDVLLDYWKIRGCLFARVKIDNDMLANDSPTDGKTITKALGIATDCV